MLRLLHLNNIPGTILLLLCIHAIFLFPLAHPGIHQTHDGENHLARFAAYKTAFLDLHFPPRWAGNLNYGYGIPVFNFFYPLPGYLAATLSIVGFSYETVFKLLLGLAFLTAPVGMFLFMSRITTRNVSLLSGVLYGLAPYQFLNMYVRGDVGESIALSILPFALFFYTKGVQNNRVLFTTYGGFIASMVLLAHHGIGLMTLPFIVLIITLLTMYNKRSSIHIGIFLILWLGTSAFFWIPALIEHRYTHASLFIGDMYKQHFLSFPEIITKSWGFGADVNSRGGQAPQVGILPFVVFCISIIFSKKKQRNLLVIVLLTFFIISIFLTTSSSEFLWQQFSLLQKYQFPWRFMALSTLSLPIIVGMLCTIKKQFVYILLIILIMCSSFGFGNSGDYIHRPDEWYNNFPGTTFYHGETLTIWSDGAAFSYPEKPVTLIEGQAEIQNIQKKTQLINVDVNSQTDTNIRFNTLYYPGWRAYIDGAETDIQFQDPNNRGIITVRVPSGEHMVYIRFTETKLRLLANAITIISLLTALFLFIWSKKQHGYFS